MTKLAKPKTQAPKGQYNSAQGNALGNAVPEHQSPEGARQALDVPRGWKLTTVDESIQIIDYRGRTPPFDGDAIPHLRSQNVKSGRIVWNDLAYVSEATYTAFMTRGIPQNGDILFTTEAPLGEVAPVPEERFSLAQRIMVLRPSPKVWSPLFLMYQLMSPEVQARIRRKGTGSTVTGVASRNFKSLELRVAPIEDQRRIVTEIEKQFTRLEAGVAALRRVQANLKRYRAAVLKAACEGRLVPTEAELARTEGRPFESGQQLLARILTKRRQNWQGRGQYKEPDGPESDGLPKLPAGWAWSSLDQLLGFMRNGISVKPDAEMGLPILRISAVRALSVNLAEVRYLNAEASDYPDYALFEGDLLFTRYNGNSELVGVCGVVPTITSPLVHPDKLIRCKLVPEGALSDFVATMANVGASRNYLAKRVRTTAGQAGISGGDLKGLPIPLAPLAEQTRIVAEVERRLSVVEELEAVVTTNLQRATRLRQSILQKAFTGELG